MKTLADIKTLSVTAEVEVLRAATKKFIIDEGGKIGRSWDMHQCGNTVWWESFGYVGDQCVLMRYYQGGDSIQINNRLIKIVVE
jgi:hypothetical protein